MMGEVIAARNAQQTSSLPCSYPLEVLNASIILGSDHFKINHYGYCLQLPQRTKVLF